MATLPPEVVEHALRLAYECEWDEIDVEKELARRRFLRAAALVCRRWAGPASVVLGETVLIRRLGDFEAVDRAAASGALRLERVQTLVLDEWGCRDLDGPDIAWALLEKARGGPVPRNAATERGAALKRRAALRAVRDQFVPAAFQLACRLHGLQQLRSTLGRTLSTEFRSWPVTRLAIQSLLEEDDYEHYEHYDWPNKEVWAAIARWTGLTALSVLRASNAHVAGLHAIPGAVCARLRWLRIGVDDGCDDAGGEPQSGVLLRRHLFAGPTPVLQHLDIRLSGPQWCQHISADDWPTMIFGHYDEPDFVPPLKRLVIGWPHTGLDCEGARPLLRRLPATMRELVVAIGGTVAAAESTTPVMRFLGVLIGALLERQAMVGLERLEVDLRVYELDAAEWRSHARWAALERTCRQRGIQLALTIGAGHAEDSVLVGAA